MPSFFLRYALPLVLCGLGLCGHAVAQTQRDGAPRVVIPTGSRPVTPTRSIAPTSRILYPWKTHITATIFWCGEQPTARNPTPNCKSSWDTAWAKNFGGYDDPAPEKRIPLTGVLRGTHVLQALIINGDGQVLTRSPVVTFTLHRASRLSPP